MDGNVVSTLRKHWYSVKLEEEALPPFVLSLYNFQVPDADFLPQLVDDLAIDDHLHVQFVKVRFPELDNPPEIRRERERYACRAGVRFRRVCRCLGAGRGKSCLESHG